MTTKFITKKIGEVAEIRRGASPRPIDDWMAPEGVPWVKISDATKNDSRYIYETEGFIKPSGASKSVEVYPEDLIVSNSATPGLPKIMKIHACIHDGWLLLSDFKGVTRDYLYYQIKFMRKYLINQGNGSIFTNLKTEILRDFPIQIPVDANGNPDLKKQDRIVSSLIAIEEKIDINNQTGEKLQELARNIYNRFFIQFEFLNDAGKPYKSSKGEMKKDENFPLEIPSSWKISKLSALIKTITTGLNPRDNFVLTSSGYRYLTVKNLTDKGYIDFQGCDYVDETARNLIHERSLVQEGDILFASIAPLGRCYLIQEDPKDWDINESVFCVKPMHDYLKYYLYMLLTSDYFIEKAENSSTGSVFNGLRISTMNDLWFVEPPKDIVLTFNNYLKPIFDRLDTLNKETYKLYELRDELLPLLMNGQVSIKDSKE